MSDHAVYQVLDLIKGALVADAGLTGWNIVTDRSADDAFQEEEMPAINIYAESLSIETALMQGQVIYDAMVNCDVLRMGDALGQLSRKTLEGVGLIQRAIRTSFNSGVGPLVVLQSIEEQDVAPPMETGLNVSGASLQYRVVFYTPTDDPFTITPAN